MSRLQFRNLPHLLIPLFTFILFVLIFFPGCSGGGGGGGSADYGSPQPAVTPTAPVTPDTTALEYDTTYFWQVEAYSSDGRKSAGSVWSFTTASEEDKGSAFTVTPDTAKTVALQHINRLRGRQEFLSRYSSQLEKLNDGSIVSVEAFMGEGTAPLAYIINLNPSGYIVVPASSSLPPVLAYSLKSSLNLEDDANNAFFHMLRTDLKLRNKAIDEKSYSRTTAVRNRSLWSQYLSGYNNNTEKAGNVWGPHLTSATWNQGSPYNSLCPVDPQTQRKSTVGCVAVSIAQVMNFWQYPRNIDLTSADNYTTRTRNIEIDASSAGLPSIGYNNGSPDDSDIAGLCLAVGILIETDYTDGGSGAEFYPAYLAMRDRMGFKKAVCETYITTGFSPANLMEEMKKGRPSVLCITSDKSAHSIDADGYDEVDGTFHLNFGWGGQNDGWYSLPQGMPGYNVVEAAIIRISPDSITPEQNTPCYPGPGNNADNVSPDITLTWSCSEWDYYNLYLWKSHQSKPSIPTASNLTNTYFKP